MIKRTPNRTRLAKGTPEPTHSSGQIISIIVLQYVSAGVCFLGKMRFDLCASLFQPPFIPFPAVIFVLSSTGFLPWIVSEESGVYNMRELHTLLSPDHALHAIVNLHIFFFFPFVRYKEESKRKRKKNENKDTMIISDIHGITICVRCVIRRFMFLCYYCFLFTLHFVAPLTTKKKNNSRIYVM